MSRFTTLAALLLSALGLVYALRVEPGWVEVTPHDLRQSGTGDPIRIVQLSDLHLQAMGPWRRPSPGRSGKWRLILSSCLGKHGGTPQDSLRRLIHRSFLIFRGAGGSACRPSPA